MSAEIDEFIRKARAKGLDDSEIQNRLSNGGWAQADIDEALDDLVVPPPPNASNRSSEPVMYHTKPNQPVSVVQNLSVRGFEYMVMFITLLASAFSVGWLAHSFINTLFSKASNTYDYGGTDSFSTFAVTILLVSFPIFAYMFIRLKKAELADPSLRHDSSRRKLTQLTQLVTFVVGLGYLIYFIYNLITPETGYSSSYSVDSSPSFLEQLLHMLVTMTIAGGIFLYLWRDEHREA